MTSLGNIFPFLRRASSPSSIASLSTAQSQIEILYILPDARIVEFKPPALNSESASRNENSFMEVEPGTIPWASRYERTIAVGSLRIYRAPGSVVFLNCQNAIRPILPKSQAWCVDGESKFVLRSPPLFWRIEAPNGNHDEILRVKDFKKILDQILRFEKTPCPFSRTFKVEPIPPTIIPCKKNLGMVFDYPKAPKNTEINISHFSNNYNDETYSQNTSSEVINSSTSSITNLNSPDFSQKTLSLKYKSEGLVSKTSNISESLSILNLELRDDVKHSDNLGFDDSFVPVLENVSNRTEKTFVNLTSQDRSIPKGEIFEENVQFLMEQQNTSLSSRHRQRPFTPPPIQRPFKFSSSKELDLSPKSNLTVGECQSEAPSSSSVRSLKSWQSPLNSPSNFSESSSSSEISSYSYSCKNQSLPVPENSIKQDSNITMRSKSVNLWNDHSSVQEPVSSTSNGQKYDNFDEEIFGIPTKTSFRDFREFSQNHSILDGMQYTEETSLTPDLSNKLLQMAYQRPTTIFRKTYELFFNPTGHILQVMLQIASKIASGQWRGALTDFGQPIHWNFEDDCDDSEWYEDDFGNSNVRVKWSDKVLGS